MATPTVACKRDVMEEVTTAVIEALERGVTPWRRPWVDGQSNTEPHNAISHRAYSGINYVVLTMQGIRYTSTGWLTFKQAKDAGGSVRKGEKGTAIVFWKPLDRTKKGDDGTDRTERFLMMRTFTVFNIEQTEGVKLPQRRGQPVLTVVDPDDALGAARGLVSRLVGCSIAHGGNRAFYSPGHDSIRVPEASQFSSLEHYRATVAHECTHATGAKSRLDRDLTGRFGTESYAAEELVAELGAAMIGARLGFDTALLEHHASYLESWLRVLKGDRKAILTAASKAQQACNYLCPVESAEEEEDSAPLPIAA